jgi:HEAT repeat protein
MRMLGDECSQVRDAASRTLRKVPVSELAEHTSIFLQLLDRNLSQVRRAALEVMCMLPPAALAAHAAVVVRMVIYDGEGDVRDSATGTLSTVDRSVLAEHASIIVEALGDGVADTRIRAFNLLKLLWSEDRAVHTPAIMRVAILDPEREVRALAIFLLHWLNVEVLTEHASVILEALGHSVAGVREQALNVFTKLPLASLAPLTTTVIRRTMSDPDWSVRVRATRALSTTRALSSAEVSALASEHVLILRDMLGYRKADARKFALKVMGKLPPAAMAPHVSAVVEMLGDQVKCVREAAMMHLKKPEYAPLLLRLSADDHDVEVRRLAKQVLRVLPRRCSPAIRWRRDESGQIVRESSNRRCGGNGVEAWVMHC